MSNIPIPPEALEAAATAIFDASPFRQKEGPLHMQSDAYQALTRAYARAACLALIQSWPGMMTVSEVFTAGGDFYRPHIILPIIESSND